MRTVLPAYKKPPKWDLPYLIDLVKDNVRSRVVFPIVALSLYILLVFVLLDPAATPSRIPSGIVPALPFKQQYPTGSPFTNTYPAPRIKVSNENGGIAGLPLHALFTDFIGEQSTSNPNCDNVFRKSQAGTLEYIRLHEVCKIKTTNASTVTDSTGYAIFNSFGISRGPSGTYSFVFAAPVDGELYPSAVYSTLLTSVAAQLNVTTPPAFNYDLTGNPLAPTNTFITQPVVQVCDNTGAPIPNKTVIAFSWPEPLFAGWGSTYNIEAGKFAWLENAVSLPSDVNGYANFTNLTVLGSTSKYMYLYFHCDGVVTQFWGKQPSPGQLTFNIPVYLPPVNLLTAVAQVVIVQNMPPLATEGRALPWNPVIQVLDINNNPLPNRMVFAKLYSQNGFPYTYGYQRFNWAQLNKDLLQPIPGIYNTDFLNPLIQGELMIPILTDANGMVEFEGMHFSQYGPAGNYSLVFICDGIYSLPSQSVQVLTTVTAVTWIVQPPPSLNDNIIYVDVELAPILQITNDAGNGIYGKTATVTAQVINPTTGLPIADTYNVQQVFLIVDNKRPDAYPSDTHGFQNLYFHFQSIYQASASVRLMAVVDGVTSYSRTFTLIRGREIVSCGAITINATSAPSGSTITSGSTQTLSFNVFNSTGQPFTSAQSVTLQYDYIADSPTVLNPAVYQAALSNGNPVKVQSNAASGLATMSFTFNGPTGAIYLKARVVSILNQNANPNLSLLQQATLADALAMTPTSALWQGQETYTVKVCESPVIIYNLTSGNAIGKIAIDTPLVTPNFTTPLVQGVNRAITLTYYNKNGQLITNQQVNPVYNFVQLPPYLVAVPVNNFLAITIPPASTTNAQGQITITWQILGGNPGLYGVNFFQDGVYSDPYLFKTDFLPVGSWLNITQPPQQPGTDPNLGMDVGLYLSQTSAYLYDNNNNSLPGYYVIAAIYRTSINRTNNLTVMMGPSDTGNPTDDFLVLNPGLTGYKSMRTNIIGKAVFNSLTVMDSWAYQCFSFVFYVGQPEMYINSTYIPTNSTFTPPVCFNSYVSNAAASQQYSRYIVQNLPFNSQLSYTITRGGQWNPNDYFMVTANPYQLNSNDILNPAQAAPFLLKNWQCAYLNQQILAPYAGNCNSQLTVTTKSGNYYFNVNFTNLQWQYSASNTNFRLSVAPPLGYVRINPNTSNPILRYPATTYAIATDLITVTNTPASVVILNQLPGIIFVGDTTEVKVSCLISSGTAVPRTAIIASIVSVVSDASDYLPSQLQNILITMATGKTDVGSLNGMASFKNIQLDPSTTLVTSDNYGLATFDLKISSGLPGNYSFVFQAGNIKSDFSSTFTVLNYVDSIVYASSIGTSFEVPQLGQLIALPIQPQLLVNFTFGIYKPHKRNYGVCIYDQITDQTFLNQLNHLINITNGWQTINTLYSEVLYSNSSKSATSQLGTLINIITNGGAASAINSSIENFAYTYATPTEQNFTYNGTDIAGAYITFSDLSIAFTKYGSYQIVITIDGAESIFSDVITIVAPTPSAQKTFMGIFEKVLVAATAATMLLGNSPFHHILWIVLSYVVTIATLGVLWISHSNSVWIGLIYACTACLLLALFELTYRLIERARKNKSKMLFHTRQEAFYEYTFQMWNKKPSQLWKVSRRRENLLIRNPYEPLTEREKSYIQEENPKTHRRYIDEFDEQDRLAIEKAEQAKIETERKEKLKIKEEDEKKEQAKRKALEAPKNPPPNQKSSCFKKKKGEPETADLPAQSPATADPFGADSAALPEPSPIKVQKNWWDKEEIDPYFATKHLNLTMGDQLKRMFTPFTKTYSSADVGDCFFYPQRLLAGGLLAFMSVAYFVYQSFSIIVSLYTTVHSMSTKVKDAFYQALSNGFPNFTALYPGASIPESSYTPLEAFLGIVVEQIDLIVLAIYTAFIIGVCISIIVFMVAFIVLLADFKDRVMKMRRGIYTFDTKMIKIDAAVGYIGFQLANAAVSYMIVTFMITIVFTLFCYVTFWKMIYEILALLLILIIIGIVALGILFVITKKLKLVEEFQINHRRLFAIFELYTVFQGLVGGIMSSIMRLVMMYAISLIGLARLDQPLYPKWVLKYAYLDAGNQAYLAMTLMYHNHNNPIAVTFACLLLKSLEHTQKMTEAEKQNYYFKKRRLANWMYLAYMMKKHKKWLEGKRFIGIAKDAEEGKEKSKEKKGKEVNVTEMGADADINAGNVVPRPFTKARELGLLLPKQHNSNKPQINLGE
jgi:hypothetical protein